MPIAATIQCFWHAIVKPDPGRDRPHGLDPYPKQLGCRKGDGRHEDCRASVLAGREPAPVLGLSDYVFRPTSIQSAMGSDIVADIVCGQRFWDWITTSQCLAKAENRTSTKTTLCPLRAQTGRRIGVANGTRSNGRGLRRSLSSKPIISEERNEVSVDR